MQSLLKADGYYTAGYRELAEIVRHVSSQPARDLQRLYLQMVFNVMIGNTDDHLKNFLMIHSEEGWRLGPAFDLVPNIGFNREHTLAIALDHNVPDREILLKEARYFGIKRRQQAVDLIEVVYESVCRWETIFLDCDIPEKDRRIIGSDIKERLKRTRHPR